MANDRIYLKCNECGEELFLGKTFNNGFYYCNYNYEQDGKTLEDRLNDFYDKYTYCKKSHSDGDFDIYFEYRDGLKDRKIKNLEEKIKELEDENEKIIHEVCEKIRDQFIYKNGTKEYDCDYDISSKRLNVFLCELDGVGDDWKDEN